MKKYEITNELSRPFGEFAYRIKALKDFSDVKAGDLGGFVQSESNLSQEGDCWLYDDSMCINNARVEENAKLYNESMAYDNSVVGGNAKMYDKSKAYESSSVYGNAKMFTYAKAFGKSEVFGNAELTDMSTASMYSWVCGDAILRGQSNATEKTTLNTINITGLYYNVTIMDNHIAVDCITKTFDEWINDVTDRELLMFDGKKAVMFMKEYKDMLMSVVNSNRDYKVNNHNR